MTLRTCLLSLAGGGIILATCVYVFQDQIVDRVLPGKLKDSLRPAYRRIVYSTLSLAGRNPMCRTAEADAGISRAAKFATQFTERLIQEDHGMALYATPLGQFWIPKSMPLGGFHIMMAEGLADVYGFEVGHFKDAIVLDCGANIGSFTRTALNKGAKLVVAIEPTPELVAALRRTFAKEVAEGRVIVYPKGVWDTDSSLTLHTSVDTPWTNTFMPSPGHQDAGDVEAPLIPIDKMVAELGLERIDFIKMDIEGAESKAIVGATGTIRRFKPTMAIAVEHTSDVLRNARDVLDIVTQRFPVYQHKCILCIWGARIPKLILPDIIYFEPTHEQSLR